MCQLFRDWTKSGVICQNAQSIISNTPPSIFTIDLSIKEEQRENKLCILLFSIFERDRREIELTLETISSDRILITYSYVEWCYVQPFCPFFIVRTEDFFEVRYNFRPETDDKAPKLL